jgi:hypothetical protein
VLLVITSRLELVLELVLLVITSLELLEERTFFIKISNELEELDILEDVLDVFLKLLEELK